MLFSVRQALTAALLVSAIPSGFAYAQEAPKVTAVKLTGGAIQPQIAMDSKGVVNLIYYKGDPGAGDIWYMRSVNGGSAWSTPIRVNSQDGSAIAAGNIRGAQLAIGKNGRVHVAWNGSSKAEPKGPPNPGIAADSPYSRSAMLYTRMNDTGTAFEPQRQLMQHTYGLDGGGSVAADAVGNVYVVWHAGADGSKGEAARRLFVARSTDDGVTFSREEPAWDKDTGACGCCGVRAFADSKGGLHILYRSATGGVDRDIYQLNSNDHGKTFQGARVHQWNINACPMSSESMAERKDGNLLSAWETKGEVYFDLLNPDGKLSDPTPAPPGGEGRKYPVIVTNGQGQTLFAWTEGMGWERGGALAWQVYDQNGKPIAGDGGRQPGVPAWSLVAAFTRPDGSFTIVY